jgi:ABC-type multidrug transport system fused ATPase/permease subunit
MKRCLIIAPITSEPKLPKLPNEVQELTNILGEIYSVKILQDPVSRSTLQNLLNTRDLFELVMVGAHADQSGIVLSQNEIISASEFGNFLLEIGARQVVLNACATSIHALTIQQIIPDVDIIASIGPTIDDGVAWASALYFARALVRLGDFKEAYFQVMASTPYRLFPSRKSSQMSTRNEIDVQALAQSVEALTRALQGDQFSKTSGLIEMMRSHQIQLQKYIESDEEVKKQTNDRLTRLEDAFQNNRFIAFSPASAIAFVVIMGLVSWLISWIVVNAVIQIGG